MSQKKSMEKKSKVATRPKWLEDILESIAHYENRIVNGPLFNEMAAGTLSISRVRGALLNFYPLVENFPAYMAAAIQKIPPGKEWRNDEARDWLLSNINIERKHVLWYWQWACDFGVPPKAFAGPVFPPPAMDAINNYLWRITAHGTFAECIAAVNYAIEKPTGIWTKALKANIRAYRKQPGVTFGNATLFWVKAHGGYDDRHPKEALKLIEAFATTREEQLTVKLAMQRGMEYYAMAADACYELFK